MQKNMLLNIAGAAVLTLLCACGTATKQEESAAMHQEEKRAEESMNETDGAAQVEAQAEALAAVQAEGAQVAEADVEAGTEATQQVAEAEVPTAEQKA